MNEELVDVKTLSSIVLYWHLQEKYTVIHIDKEPGLYMNNMDIKETAQQNIFNTPLSD
jgi:hypothetical protein